MGKKRIGVVLCGAGHRDGSEIHEATCTLLAIDRAGAEAVCISPKGEQRFVRDHASGEESGERRDMFAESARISRGNLTDLKLAKAAELDALIIPGGQGAGLNLSSFLADGENCSVNPDLAKLVTDMCAAKKPVGAVCIAPAILARILKDAGISARVTIGDDESVAGSIESMGHRHEKCPATGCVADAENLIFTTPAYMNARSIGEVWQGIEKLVAAIMETA